MWSLSLRDARSPSSPGVLSLSGPCTDRADGEGDESGGCVDNEHHRVFAASATDEGFMLTVRDTTDQNPMKV